MKNHAFFLKHLVYALTLILHLKPSHFHVCITNKLYSWWSRTGYRPPWWPSPAYLLRLTIRKCNLQVIVKTSSAVFHVDISDGVLQKYDLKLIHGVKRNTVRLCILYVYDIYQFCTVPSTIIFQHHLIIRLKLNPGTPILLKNIHMLQIKIITLTECH